MARLLTALLISLLASTSFAQAPSQAPYDHVIIFGDSLSDIGDMPMSPGLIEPSTHQIALNLYVPISNPMVPDGRFYRVPLTNQYLTYPQPSPTPSPLMNVNGTIYPRVYKSLNWAQFFVHDVQQAGLVQDQQTLVPWAWWRQYSNKVRSIDFAFAGATSEDKCRDFEYQHPNLTCNAKSVFHAQIPYRMAGFLQNNSASNPITLVQVPGVEKQVSMFLAAAKKHPQLATPNTLYIIFVGGNDLNLDLFNLSKHHYLAAFGALLHGTKANVSKSIDRLKKQVGAKHIIVMNLFDMRETPYLHTNIINILHLTPHQEKHLLQLTHVAVSLYDSQLKHMVERMNLFKHMLGEPTIVSYFDTASALKEMTASSVFNQTRTRFHMCIKQFDVPPGYYTKQKKCINGGAKYLFWNGAHPSIYVGEYLGYRLMQQLEKV
jgi:phospholipase/lecithinase/hemolysin